MAAQGPFKACAAEGPGAKEGLFSGSRGGRQAAAARAAPRRSGAGLAARLRRLVLVIARLVDRVGQGVLDLAGDEGRGLGVGDRQLRQFAERALAAFEAWVDQLPGLGVGRDEARPVGGLVGEGAALRVEVGPV